MKVLVNVRRYAFYTLIAVLAALTVHDVIELFDEYLENPKQVDMQIVFNETIEWPRLTFCAPTRQFVAFFSINASLAKTWDEDLATALAHFPNREAFLERPWTYQMTAEGMMVVMALTSLEVEVAARGVPANLHQLPRAPRLHGKNQMINDWMHRLQALNVSYAEFLQKTGSEMLERGLRRLHRVTPDGEHEMRNKPRITWLSQQHFCFQVIDEDEPIDSQGQFLLVQLQADLDKLIGHDLPCMTVDFHGRPSPFARYMSAEARDGVADDICLGQYVEISAEVKTIFDMLPTEDEGRMCVEAAETGQTDYECKLSCRINYIRGLCRCTPISLQHLVRDPEELHCFPPCNYTKCNINPKTIDLTEEPKCQENCRRDCHQVRYSISRSNSKMTRALTKKHSEIVGRDRITASFAWSSFEYVSLEQSWKFTFVSFTAALGGAIGIYLGLSVLTLIVAFAYGVDFALFYCIDSWQERRSNRRVTSAEDAS